MNQLEKEFIMAIDQGSTTTKVILVNRFAEIIFTETFKEDMVIL